jgi:hypothetical protein
MERRDGQFSQIIFFGGTGVPPVLAQAKACGYILHFPCWRPMQNCCRTLLNQNIKGMPSFPSPPMGGEG